MRILFQLRFLLQKPSSLMMVFLQLLNISAKAGLETCKKSYCELQSLCRIGELLQRGKSAQPADREEAGA